MVTNVSYEVTGTAPVVTLEQAKKHLKIEPDFTEEDDIIQMYIDAAVETSELFIGGHIVEKTMTLQFDSFEKVVEFEAFPLKEIVSINYFAENETTATVVPSTDYSLTSINSKVFKLTYKVDLPKLDKRSDAITVILKIGFTEYPKLMIAAILLKIADMYEKREDRSAAVLTVSEKLLKSYKRYK